MLHDRADSDIAELFETILLRFSTQAVNGRDYRGSPSLEINHGASTTFPIVPRLEIASKAPLTSVKGKELFANNFTFLWEIRLRRLGTHSAICSGRNDGKLNPVSDWLL
jgi:hypothetical protein